MVVVPPELFDKWKDVFLEDQKLSFLDKEMKNVLNNSKLDDINKWYLYREKLLKYLHSKKKNDSSNNKSKILVDQSTQSNIEKSNKKIHTKNVKVQTENKKKDVETQVQLPRGQQLYEEMFHEKPFEEMFQNTTRYSSIDEADLSILDDENNF